MSLDNIFIKIINKEIPAEIVYQDSEVTAFKDINPQAPHHILIIPNAVIPTVNDIDESQQLLVGKLFLIAARLAKEFKIDQSGYRLIVNCNNDGGQEVYHLHMHLLGGKQLGPMLSKD